ncbi:MAG: tryptophan synthase subunit alpha [Planctomycetes bacterium]|nr:tryptophan synthase subunit alpha [Planctomycetota bacterium]
MRKALESAGDGSQVVAYLTLGDPPGRFLEVAHEVLDAGALTLELGFPHPSPREGRTLLDSHRRALDAGVDTERALHLLGEISRSHVEVPLVAVVQWSAVEEDQQQCEFLEGLSQAGAAAVLPIDVPLGKLSRFAERVHSRGMETVLSCFPDTPARLRRIALQYCSGCIYVPRGRGTGSQEVVEIEAFCSLLASETELPMVVGFGVERAEDVAEICATKAVAAAVGSALVKRIAEGEDAGAFVSSLITNSF